MVNVPNRGAFAGMPYERVAEVPCRLDRLGATPLVQGGLPGELSGLIEALAEYQALAAEAGWYGNSRDAALKALAANPLVWKLDAERIEAMFDEMAGAHGIIFEY
jgi:6-phospho-beta-glucosidase